MQLISAICWSMITVKNYIPVTFELNEKCFLARFINVFSKYYMGTSILAHVFNTAWEQKSSTQKILDFCIYR